jgi:hypothetical protein
MKIKDVLKSPYCWLVIFISLLLSYFLIIKNFTSFTNFWSVLLSVIYILAFALSNSCLIKEIKDRIQNQNKTSTKGFFSIIGSLLGFSAIHLCTISGVCGVNIFISLLLSIFPTSISFFIIHNGIWLLLIADVFLIFSIVNMKCFKRNL